MGSAIICRYFYNKCFNLIKILYISPNSRYVLLKPLIIKFCITFCIRFKIIEYLIRWLYFCCVPCIMCIRVYQRDIRTLPLHTYLIFVQCVIAIPIPFWRDESQSDSTSKWWILNNKKIAQISNIFNQKKLVKETCFIDICAYKRPTKCVTLKYNWIRMWYIPIKIEMIVSIRFVARIFFRF